MNERISWDQYLVKKYSSSNHLKMLNQLRNEVKKYPLPKKKNITSDLSYENKNVKMNKEISAIPQELNSLDKSNLYNEKNSNSSTVSFNNSKDFSIYSNKNNDQKKDLYDNNSIDIKVSNDQSSSSTFKDRLNQIDLK